jgi:regulator of replication initiation timing
LESDERVKNNYTKIKQNESSIEQLISTLTLSRKKCAWENDELKLELDQLEEHLSQEIRRVAKPINIL